MAKNAVELREELNKLVTEQRNAFAPYEGKDIPADVKEAFEKREARMTAIESLELPLAEREEKAQRSNDQSKYDESRAKEDGQTNASLQEKAVSLLKGLSGSAVVMDLKNGAIVAMASTPGFDGNKFVGGISENYWRKLINDPHKPMINKSLQNSYPPGSVFKIIVALAAMGEGFDPKTKFHCTGGSIVGTDKFKCWYRPGHGFLDLEQAISRSCNTYMYHIAKKIGAEPIIKMARKFGLGSMSNVDLPFENAGFVPDAEWKMGMFKQPWSLTDSLNISIGQGALLASPLQLARFCGAIATNGKLFTPNVGIRKSDYINIDINPEHLKLVQQGMFNVVNDNKGTAYWHRIIDQDWMFAGKTGTAQVRSNKRNTNEWSSKNHAIFMGYAPFDNPLFSTAVVVEHGGSGSVAAAPIVKELFVELKNITIN